VTDTKKTTIQITCECGKKYRCRSHRIGQTVRCRSCGNSILVADRTLSRTTWTDEAPRIQSETKPDGTKPDGTKSDRTRSDRTRSDRTDDHSMLIWCCTWGIASLAMVLFASVIQTVLDGPEFMGVFIAFLVTIVVAGLLIRLSAPIYLNAYFVAAFLTYELIAIVRLVYGINAGMSRFDDLKAMMVIGPLALSFVAISTSNGHGGLNGGSSSSSGGCGGGGGGGGGCGGCGGG
jgi:hypothetical protein